MKILYKSVIGIPRCEVELVKKCINKNVAYMAEQDLITSGTVTRLIYDAERPEIPIGRVQLKLSFDTEVLALIEIFEDFRNRRYGTYVLNDLCDMLKNLVNFQIGSIKFHLFNIKKYNFAGYNSKTAAICADFLENHGFTCIDSYNIDDNGSYAVILEKRF